MGLKENGNAGIGGRRGGGGGQQKYEGIFRR
jgi:hypothetical protein